VFSSLLGAGMNVHLKDNGFLRSVFSLDDREGENDLPNKGNRFERVRHMTYDNEHVQVVL
jgi:hypothetical protein